METSMSLKKSTIPRKPGARDARVLAQHAEVRAVGDSSSREFIARVIQYNVVDDYGTVWLPGCFADSLNTRMPRVAWAHSWQDPIGVYKEVVKDDGQVLELLGKLSEFEAVPRARQAWAQMDDGTIDQFSVGFTRRTWHDIMPGVEVPGVSQAQLDAWRAAGAWEVMVKADLDEASPVLVGAVPGTALLAVRAAGMVDIDQVVELAKRVKAGELSQEEAQAAVTLLAGEAVQAEEQETGEPPAEGAQLEAEAEVEQLLAEAEDVLARGRR
jgi:HK97 family phage prohead protease